MPAPPKQVPRSPWRRRAWRALLALSALLLLALTATATLLSNLDRPSVKSRLLSTLHSAAGVELDFTSARGSLLSGLHFDDLQIATPRSLRPLAPVLLRARAVDLTWALTRLARTSPTVDAVTIHDLDVTIVLDKSGRTSFDFEPATAAPPPPRPASPPAPPTPLSRLLHDLLATPLPVRSLAIDLIRLTLLRADGATVVDKLTLEGMRVALSASPDPSTPRIELALGTEASPLELILRRETTPPAAARLRLSVSLSATPQHATAAVDARLISQSFAPAIHVDQLISLALAADIDPAHHRVLATISRAALGDGAFALTAELEQPDDASSPLVHRLDGTLEAPRLLALAPPELAPRLPTVAEGRLALHAVNLALAPAPRVLPGGDARLSGKLTRLHAALAGVDATARALSVDLHANPDGAFDGKLHLQLDQARVAQPNLTIALADATLALSFAALRLAPTVSSGPTEISLHLGSLHATAGALTAIADPLTLIVKGRPTLAPPYAGSAHLTTQRLQLLQTGRALLDDAIAVDLDAGELFPAPARPLQTRGSAHLRGTIGTTGPTGTSGAIALSLDLKKLTDALDYTLSLAAPSLTRVGALLAPKHPPPIDWAKLGANVRSTGHVASLAGTPSLRHDTTLELTQLSLANPRAALTARTLRAQLRSNGTLRQHEGDLTLAVSGLTRDGDALGDGQLGGNFHLDGAAPLLRVKLASSGAAAPGLDANLDASFDRAHRRLTFDLKATLQKLDPLAPVLAQLAALRAFRAPGLSLSLTTHGVLAGLVDAISPDGAIALAKDPLSHLTGDADFDVRAAGLHWHSQDRAVDTPAIGWHGTLQAATDRRTLHSELTLGELHLAIGPTRIDLADLTDGLDVVVTGDPRLGEVEVKDHLALRALRQELLPDYPTAQLAFTLDARRDREGVIRIPELRIDDAAAGTSVGLRGGLDLGEDRRSLSLRGSLTQDLAKLWTAPRDFAGKGALSVDVRVDSGDLRRYRVTSSLRVKDGHLELPRKKIKVDAIDGEIPLVAEVAFEKSGPRLLRNTEVNSYSELRFADQHPLLSRRSFLSVARIETPWATVTQLAGNLVVDNNVLSMSQLELSVRDGRVSGRAVVALQGLDTKLQLNVRASGVRSSRGEPFDGNAAVGVSVRQHSVQGRAEILRIGRRHLLDLLDVVDPPRSDAAINRVRSALSLGYPDHLRISFNRGFASAKITLGGIARLLTIDEIRGIPMGPIIDRAIEPLLEDSEEEE